MALSQIHGSSTQHRCGHDGQRKRVAHMPTATTTTEDSRSKFGRKLPTRVHDEGQFLITRLAVMSRSLPTLRSAARRHERNAIPYAKRVRGPGASREAQQVALEKPRGRLVDSDATDRDANDPE